MKIKKLIAVLLVTIFCASLCACQPTPEAPIVMSKGDGTLEDKISQNALPEKAYEAPEHWADTVTGRDGMLTVNLDADIVIPDTLKYPVARIQKIEMSEQWISDLLSHISVDGKYYDYQDETTFTKSQVEDMIQSLMDDISSVDTDPYFADWNADQREAYIAEKQADIDDLQRYYKNAPDEFIQSEIEVKLEELNGRGETSSLFFGCRFNMGKPEQAGFQAFGTYTGEIGSVSISNFTGNQDVIATYVTDTTNLNGITVTEAEAVEMGKAFIEKMGESGFEASLITGGLMVGIYESEEERPQCYEIYFTRSVEGVPATYLDDDPSQVDPEGMVPTPVEDGDMYIYESFDRNEAGSSIPENFVPAEEVENEQYAPYWPQEYIKMLIDDTGVFSVEWNMPAKQTEVVNTNVELLPFEEIQRIFKQQMGIRCIYTDPTNSNITHHDVTITRVELGMTQIREKNTYSGLIMVPTWNFYGYETYTCAEQIYQSYDLDENNQYVNDKLIGHSFLSINAIDGSVINRHIGY